MIRPVEYQDAEAIASIYNHYVLKTIVTFEEDVVSKEEMGLRIENVTEKFPWLVYEEHGNVLGYAYASQWKSRSAFRFSVEGSVYLSPDASGRGIGAQLYRHLIDELRKQNIHCIVAGISLPNEASVRLHEKLGFEKVGQFNEIGFKLNRWIDVGYWSLPLGEPE